MKVMDANIAVLKALPIAGPCIAKVEENDTTSSSVPSVARATTVIGDWKAKWFPLPANDWSESASGCTLLHCFVRKETVVGKK